MGGNEIYYNSQKVIQTYMLSYTDLHPISRRTNINNCTDQSRKYRKNFTHSGSSERKHDNHGMSKDAVASLLIALYCSIEIN